MALNYAQFEAQFAGLERRQLTVEPSGRLHCSSWMIASSTGNTTRPVRLPNPKPSTRNPKDSGYDTGTTGGQVTGHQSLPVQSAITGVMVTRLPGIEVSMSLTMASVIFATWAKSMSPAKPSPTYTSMLEPDWRLRHHLSAS